MAADARSIIEDLYAALGARAFDRVAALYADDAELVRYDGAAHGPTEIAEFYERYISNHGTYALRELVQFRAVDDVILWDALVDTDAGILMTYDVVVTDGQGKIARHVPTVRGYWGQ